MTIIVSRCFVIRIYGSGKLRADPKFDVLSASLPPMNVTRSKVFAHPEALPPSFFSASLNRSALRNLIAID